jgi:hypothetical protein
MLFLLEPRGVGATRWTKKNPPNYVERSHVLLGRTVDAGRVWDIAATARYLRQKTELPVAVAAQAGMADLAAYAALLETDISTIILQNPVPSHMNTNAPALLNVLRVCDVPEVLGMLAPRPLTIQGDKASWKKVAEIYAAAGAANRLVIDQ